MKEVTEEFFKSLQKTNSEMEEGSPSLSVIALNISELQKYLFSLSVITLNVN
jgi:hypothetical protein